jgi:putative endonuclease
MSGANRGEPTLERAGDAGDAGELAAERRVQRGGAPKPRRKATGAGPLDGRAALGRSAEDAAAHFLVASGYEILARNVRLCGAELDIVARESGEIAFVEVRSRSSRAHGGPLETIGPRKIARLSRAATAFLALRRWSAAPARFDVVGVDWIDGRPRLSLVRGAFDCPF